jgi:hypothetical protein
MEFLKNVTGIDEGELKDSLRWHLHRHLAGSEEQRLSSIHASDVIEEDWCPRKVALLHWSKRKPKVRAIGACDRAVWDLGRAGEKCLIGWFSEMGMAVGNWRCGRCRERHEFTTLPSCCAECGATAEVANFEYIEQVFVSQESGVSGSIDLLVRMPTQTRLKLVEIKTIKQEEFRLLVAPIASHRLRSNLYMRLVAESDHEWKDAIDTQESRIIYFCKQGWGVKDPEVRKWGPDKGFSPFKEFTVERDDSQTDAACKRATPLHLYRNGHQVQIPRICATALVPTAQSCECSDLCFK